MVYNLWNKEGKWIKKNIDINSIDCLRFTCKNKAHMLFTGKIYPNIYLNDGVKYKPLEEYIDFRNIELWVKRFFKTLQKNKETEDFDKNYKLPNNILVFCQSLFVNLDNVKEIEPYKFEKGIQKNGIKITFLDGKTVKNKISKKDYIRVENIIKMYNKNKQEVNEQTL